MVEVGQPMVEQSLPQGQPMVLCFDTKVLWVLWVICSEERRSEEPLWAAEEVALDEEAEERRSEERLVGQPKVEDARALDAPTNYGHRTKQYVCSALHSEDRCLQSAVSRICPARRS